MLEMNMPTQVIRLSTQAFLILCRMFDGFYDDLKRQNEIDHVTESIANSLLDGVMYLQEQAEPPKEIAIEFTVTELFLLKKIIDEVLQRLPETADQDKVRNWLTECSQACTLIVQ